MNGNLNNALILLDRVLEQAETGFIACKTCGDQEETKDLDLVDDLTLAKSELLAMVEKEEKTINLKFKDVPLGGRIKEYGKVWVVLKNFDRGLIVEYTGDTATANKHMSHCSFVDEGEGVTLETEVNFIG